jgi:aspartyl-tRNA(Asn)/glutamyl-tRNA(Gln) amidotransferase subunit B
LINYVAVIGLEVHAQLSTASKLFCGCTTSFGGAPNTQVCPVCLGLPGSLPTLNEMAVEYALKMGLATRCRISSKSIFARKNYFYPDCPKNYQITQFDTPLCEDGHVLIEGSKKIGITRIHLEEDAGKLHHNEEEGMSFVDMNRCGVPLIEIVSRPDIRTPKEASSFMRKLRAILRYLDISDGNMEEGNLRCDVNVSLQKEGSDTFGVRTEIKNLNSFKAVELALSYEIGRQTEALDKNKKIVQHTLLWNSETEKVEIMRAKEEAHDYRYFPEPDLRELTVSQDLVERLLFSLPELPDEREKRFIDQYELPPYDADLLISSKELADYFEAVIEEVGDAKLASNWIMGEVLRELNESKIEITALRVKPAELAHLIEAERTGRINMRSAKEIFKEMVETGRTADTVIVERDLEQISNESELNRIVTRVLDGHPDEVAGYLGGKEQLFTYFIGEVMKETKGKANPQKTSSILTLSLKARRTQD